MLKLLNVKGKTVGAVMNCMLQYQLLHPQHTKQEAITYLLTLNLDELPQ